ncbi:cytochrome P450 [Yaniella halotolerans]|uniref:cytochrome P450 n=1 Tax=Yaniella halotolerans TaxID=225453 RepID=UPI0003B3A1B7|nr:cytochrome P450 [Yaniella halotolerans]
MTTNAVSKCPFTGAPDLAPASHEQQVDVPVLLEDPFEESNLADPHPMHKRLRDADADVVYLPAYDIYAVARYEAVLDTLENWQDYSSAAGVGLSNFNKEEPWRTPSLLLEADPPKHDAPRATLEKILGARQLRRFQTDWTNTAHRLVDGLLTNAQHQTARAIELDAVTEISEVYPLSVFPDAVGLQQGGLDNLLPYGNFAFNAFGPRNRLVTDELDTIGPVMEWVGQQCPRDALNPDSFGGDIWRAADQRNITEEQAPLIVRSLLTAGVDTTVYGISAVLYHLASNPEQYARLREQPQLVRRVFEEALRLESPVQTFFRTTTRKVQIGDTTLPENQKILMFLGAANRDPRRWDNADDFDLDRDPSGHLAFGSGAHQCVGQHVARLEASCVLDALIERVEGIEFAAPPVRKINNTLLGWHSLPLRFIPA